MRTAVLAAGVGLLVSARAPGAEDCNRNGVDDAAEVSEVKTQIYPLPPVLRLVSPVRPAVGDVDLDGRAEALIPLLEGSGIRRLQLGADGQAVDLPLVPTSPSPRFVRSADMDSDGDVDLAVHISPGTSALQVVLQSAAGTFQAGATVPLATFPSDIVLGDFDGDRDHDLVTNGVGATLLTFLSDGRGGMRPTDTPTALPGPGAPMTFAAGDMDLDGDLDLVAPILQPTRLALLLNDGKAAFTLREGALPGAVGVVSMGIADFTGDGKLDVAATGELGPNEIKLFANAGTPDAQFTVKTTAVRASHLALTVGDANRDGAPDLLGIAHAIDPTCVQGGSSGVWLAMNRAGELVVDPPAPVRQPLLPWPAAGDFDHNGTADLVIVNNEGSLLLARTEEGTREADCNQDSVPDSCQLAAGDCDRNGRLDSCDLAAGAPDCNRNSLPDGCEVDCDANGTPDDCDLAEGRGQDCNQNGFLDACELAAADANRNGVPDDCDLARGTSQDCNGNSVPDESDLASRHGFLAPVLPATPAALDLRQQSYAPRLATADLNGDGALDVASTRTRSCCPETEGSLLGALALGRGLSPVQHLAPVENPIDMDRIDLDQDGRDDLVVVDRGWACPADASILLYRARASIGVVRSEPLRVPGGPAAAFTVDWTGDGLEDIVVRTGHDGQPGPVRLLVNDGQGRLALTPGLGPDLAGGLSGTLADVDGDGDADLVASAQGQLVLLPNPGTNALPPTRLLATAGYYYPPLALDAEDDGDIDLITMSCEALCDAILLRNSGAARFPTREPLQARLFLQGGVVADLDADGDDDVIGVGRESSNLSLWNTQVLAVFRNGDGKLLSEPAHVIGVGEILDLAALELTGDAFPDIVVAQDGPVALPIIVNRAGELALPRGQIALPGMAAMALGDLDSDGSIDAAMTHNFLNEIVVLQGNSEGFSGVRRAIFTGEGTFGITSADLDGDARDDLAYGEATGVQVILQRTRGQWTPAPFVTIGNSPAKRLAAQDLEADGDLDLVGLTGERLITVVQAERGIFARGPSTALPAEPRDFATIELTGDGRPDVAVLGRNPTVADMVSILENDGAGKLVLRRNAPAPLEGRTISVGDLDADGIPELAVSHLQETGLTLLRREAGGAWSSVPGLQPRHHLLAAALAELNGDGRADLVTVGQHETRIEEGQGDGSFGGGQGLLLVPEEPSAIEVRDLDGDGRPDVIVVVGDDEGDWLLAFANNSAPHSFDHDTNGLPDECGPQAEVPFRRGDVDVDGAWNLTDAIAVLDHLFLSGRPLACQDAADANDDGLLDIADAVVVLGHLFLGERRITRPFAQCGFDPTADGLRCQSFSVCR